MFRITACFVLFSLVTPAIVRAQLAPTSGTPVDSDKTVIRTYDLTDLFRIPRHYPLPGKMIPATGLSMNNQPSMEGSHFGGGPMQGMPGPDMGGVLTQPVTAESVAQLVMSTVAPETWRDAGGAIGSVRFIGPRLVVSQTAANQKQIEELLNGIREEGGMSHMVSVQAYWVHFAPEDLRAIASKPGDAAGAATLKEVPDALLDDAKVYSRGQTLGYNGQTVHVASGRANTVITGMQPVVGTQAVGYQLETATVQSGVSLQVTPQVLGDGKLVSLDLHSIVSEVDDAGALPDPRLIPTDGPTTSPADASLGKRSRIIAQQFSTTARVPVGKKILVGGMTFDPGAEGVKQLYLVIEANAIK
ncbi:MAG TPA: hypothetical protein VGR35_14080 [Tepidisphaeraceae bacterium]|nr:hypothetical protein [Tepidisphaeraceae bacterium]